MSPDVRNLAACAILLCGGGLRLLWEPALGRHFQSAGLLEEPLKLNLREKVGQNVAAVALSGLRSFAATIISLRSYNQFANQRWADLATTFDTVVEFEPHSRYYWEMGSWHMGKNATSYYQYDSTLPPLRARAERLRWYHKGLEFLQRGVANNPKDPGLRITLAEMLEDSFLFPDDAAAAEQYGKALELDGGQNFVRRAYLRALVRSGKDPEHVRSMLRELLKDPQNRTVTLMCMEYAFEWRESSTTPGFDPLRLVLKVFGTEERALRMLGPYFTAVRDRWPQDGVEPALRLLESRRGIPSDSPQSNIRLHEEALNRLNDDDNPWSAHSDAASSMPFPH